MNARFDHLASEGAAAFNGGGPRSRLGFWIAMILWAGISSARLFASTLPAGFSETEVGGYWDGAVGITFDETGVMYQWDRDGRVWVFQNDVRLATPVLDIREEVGNWGDHGMLGFALHPNFRQNGYLYVLYVVDHHYLANFGTPNYNPAANEFNTATIGRITRYTARASDNFHTVDPASRTVLLGETASTGTPVTFDTHGIGTLLFGTDGTLMVSVADGSGLSDYGSDPTSFYAQALSEGILKPKENIGAFRSQLLDSFSGKILRIDPLTGDGIPSNPFYDAANPRSARSRVWDLGLRQPFRMTLRPGTGSHARTDGNPGALYIGDVGYFTWEKLSVSTGPAINFGWPLWEGYDTPSSYDGVDRSNLDAPNPLFGTGGCTQQYFGFRDLLKEATLALPSWPNPCSPSQQIPNTIPRFLHTRPALDWRHTTGPSRVGIFVGTDPAVINIGAAGSPVPGPQFDGNCSIGGAWYQGDDFPAQYKNTYFHGDFGVGWIRNFTFDANNQLVSVRDFAAGTDGIVCIATHPLTGALYYVSVFNGIRKISYGGNAAPKAVASANQFYGPGPLTVQFTGSASSDPEGGALTYRWDFGDSTPASTVANPSHVFTASPGVPTGYYVTLTVTDNAGATNATRLVISVNNTPPVVTINSPAAGTLYSVSAQTVYNLTASVTDAEQSQNLLTPQWQTVLHHNNHVHPGPFDTNWITTAVLSPFGCDGDMYFYRITLTVTDAAALSTSAFVDLYPDCANTPPSISSIVDQAIFEDASAGPLSFTINDAETTPDLLTLTAASSNPTLLPTSGIILSGSGANRAVTLFPATNQFGNTAVTLTVGDGRATAATIFNLSVTAVNDGPVVSDIPNQSVAQDSSTAAIPFTINDVDTPLASLSLSAGSSNQILVPPAGIVFGGSGANRTITVTPAAGQFGNATITVTVSDGSRTASDSFVLTVRSPNNNSPTITTVADQTIAQNTATGPLAFTVGDAETPATSLLVTGSSSNPTVAPTNGISFGGSGSNRTVTITPALNQSGVAVITLTVNDGQITSSSTFKVTVLPSGGAPDYLLAEDFEGAGFENAGWTKVGTPNPDYTNTVLHGAQSLNCTGGQQIYRTFSNSNAFYLYLKMRFITLSTYQVLMDWRDVNLNTSIEMYVNGGTVDLSHGNVIGHSTTAFVAGRTYDLWLEWTKGSGANGTLKMFVATNGTKPSLPEVNIATGTGGAVDRFTIGPESSGNVIFDQLLIDDVPIGSNPGATQNQAPTISHTSNQVTSEDTAIGRLNLTISDAETLAGSLLLSGSSGNTALLPNANISFGGSGSNRTVTLLPATNQSGSATVTLTVSDGSLTASDSFVLTVNPVNDPPTISDIPDQTVGQNRTAGPISFVIGDPETAASNLVLTAVSSNTELAPAANIVFGGSGSNRTVTVTPVTNQIGTAVINVSVSDGSLSTGDSFLLTVTTATNAPPSIVHTLDQSAPEDAVIGPLAVTIGDAETPASALLLTAASSNPVLVPLSNITLGGAASNRTVTILPATNQSGTAVITLTVNDGALLSSDSFTVTFNPVNDVPSISDIPNQTTPEDIALGPISFTIGDVETPATALVVSGVSSNPTLVPNGNLVFTGTSSNRNLTISPALNQFGSAVITVSVSDGAATASDTFTLTVNPVNDPPVISDLPDRVINEDTSTGAISFTIGDVETAAATLTLTRTSSNPALVPTNNIVFGGSGSNRTVTIVPATNQFGSAAITISVSDGALSASDSFVLTVNPVNDAPTISTIPNQSVNQDGAPVPISFAVGDVDNSPSNLVVTASSSNPLLVPNTNLVVNGSGASRTITVTPATNQTGVSTITLSVTDGLLTASSSFVLTVNATNVPAYLFAEGFEGVGFENAGWTKVGTPNPDYTNTVLFGTQSLNCSGGQQIYRTLAFSNSFYLYYKVRFVTLPTYQVLMDWRDANLNTSAEMYLNGGTCTISHGSINATTASTFAAGVTYDVWMEWTKGTGANGTFKIFVATNGQKPASPNATVSAGNGGTINRFTIGPESSGNTIFDRLLVSGSPIGSAP